MSDDRKAFDAYLTRVYGSPDDPGALAAYPQCWGPFNAAWQAARADREAVARRAAVQGFNRGYSSACRDQQTVMGDPTPKCEHIEAAVAAALKAAQEGGSDAE